VGSDLAPLEDFGGMESRSSGLPRHQWPLKNEAPVGIGGRRAGPALNSHSKSSVAFHSRGRRRMGCQCGHSTVAGLDETGIDGELPRKPVVAIAAVDIAGDERVENAIDALLSAGLPSRIVGLLLPCRAIVGHRVHQGSDQAIGSLAGEFVESEVHRIRAETAAVAIECVQRIVIGPERIPSVAVGVVPLVETVEVESNPGDGRPGSSAVAWSMGVRCSGTHEPTIAPLAALMKSLRPTATFP
jgi:hypothetical protein